MHSLPRFAILGLAAVAGAWAFYLTAPSHAPASLAVLGWSAALIYVAAAWARAPSAMVLIAFLAGASRAAWPLPEPPASGMDDRGLDQLAGVVTGPVEDLPGGRQRFTVAMGPPLPAGVDTDLENTDLAVEDTDLAVEDTDLAVEDTDLAVVDTDLAVEVTAQGRPLIWPGDRVAAVGRLRTPRGYRVPGAVPMDRVVQSRGAQVSMTAIEITVSEPSAAFSPWRLPAELQRAASAYIAAAGGHAAGNAVVRGMITGDRSAIDPITNGHFRDAGVSHVLSVSGLHLVAVTVLVFAAARRLWALVPALALRLAPASAAALMAVPVAVLFTLITGAKPATIRALLVFLLVIIGIVTARRARVIDALGVAAIAMIAVRPAVVFDPGFQLSFAATATLALTAGQAQPTGHRPLARRALAHLGRLLHASLWVLLATAPLTAASFGVVPLGGLIANLAVVPAAELVIVPAGLLGCALAPLWPAAAGMLIDLAVLVAGLLCALCAQIAAAIPALALPPPRPVELIGCMAVWAGLVASRRTGELRLGRPGLVLALGGALLVALSYCFAAAVEPRLRESLRVTFLDVGQGDAAVIELPGGAVWMIDSGGLPFVLPQQPGAASGTEPSALSAASPGEHSVLRFLAWRRIRRIDRLVLSHPHPDHYAGARAVAGAVPISELWVAAGYERVAPDYLSLLGELRTRGTRIVTPALDAKMRHAGATLTALAPRYQGHAATADPVATINDNSLVVMIGFAGRTILFTGDIEAEGEELLAHRYGKALAADIVKIPHHGSRTSSSPHLVAATEPAWAILSCGVANRFDFPAPAVVTRWEEAGATVLRTDRHGAITVEIAPDGRLRIDTFDD